MELSQIRYVLALCQTLNFTRAARHCGVSQPSLTNAIRALETELGGALFLRRPAVRLTPLGEALRPRFQRVMRELAAVHIEAGHDTDRVAMWPNREGMKAQPAAGS
jgi:LysR family transcriptional regulator, hydrogen peroxide-inducible genes activator